MKKFSPTLKSNEKIGQIHWETSEWSIPKSFPQISSLQTWSWISSVKNHQTKLEKTPKSCDINKKRGTDRDFKIRIQKARTIALGKCVEAKRIYKTPNLEYLTITSNQYCYMDLNLKKKLLTTNIY